MRPIFIIGMNGSGTTMLADCLNQHPQIYIHRIESRTIPFYYFNLGRFGDLENEENFSRLLTEFSNNSAFWICNDNQPLEISFDFNDLNQKDLSTVIDMVFSYFASREKKRIWGDHSPKYGFFIPVLIDLFPEAKIIHIIRDGRDCVQSFNRRFAYNKYRAIYNWRKLIEKAGKDGSAAGEDRYFEVKYEDLTDAPEHWMKHICFFLGVPYDANVLVSNMPMFKGEGDESKSIVKNTGKWRASLTSKEIRKLESIGGLTLQNLGYEVLYAAGNNDLSAARLFFLRWLDRANTSISYYRRYNGQKKVRRFVKYVSASLKQGKNYRY